MFKAKSLALILGVFIMSFLVGYLVFAWTEPTAVPPGANVPAPLNVGSVEQWKQGELGIGFATPPFDIPSGGVAAKIFYDADDSSWYVNPSGNSVFSGSVGIGITSPVGKLHIGGTAPRWINFGITGVAAPAVGSSGTKLVLYGSETSNNPRYAMGIASGEFWYSSGGVHKWYTESGGVWTSRMTILNNGNVGIGTTTPGYKLDVNGDINVPATGFLRIAGSTGSSGQVLTRTATGMTWQTVSGAVPDGTLAGQTLRWTGLAWIADSNLFNNGTNVGIGTTSPGQKLDVAGNINYTGQLTKLNVADNFTATVGAADFYLGYSTRRGTPGRAIVDLGSDLRFNYGGDWSTASVGSSLNVYGNLLVSGLTNCNTIDTDASGNLICGTDETGVGAGLWTDAGTYIYPNNYTSLAITDTGNVGIGTTSPGYKLDVQGGDSRVQNLYLGGTGIEGSINKADQIIGYNDLRFYGDTSGGPDMFITSGGNVGIGTTSPGAKLDVMGSGMFSSSTGNADIQLNSATRPTIYPNGGYTPANLNLQIRSKGTGALQLNADNSGNVEIATGGGNVGIGKSPGYKLDVDGTVSASYLRTRSQACPATWSCEVNTWDIAAQSARLYGGLLTDGQIVAGGAGGGQHLMINDITGARWTLGTGGYDLTFYNDYNDGIFREKVRFTEAGDLSIGWEMKSASGSVDGGSTGYLYIDCSAGKRVLGGGCTGSAAALWALRGSYPRDADTWECQIKNNSSFSSTMYGYAICARLAP